MDDLVIGELLQVSAPNQYVVVCSYTSAGLAGLVEEQMKYGWECQGGVFAEDRFGNQFFYQAMVRRPVTNIDYEKSKGDE